VIQDRVSCDLKTECRWQARRSPWSSPTFGPRLACAVSSRARRSASATLASTMPFSSTSMSLLAACVRRRRASPPLEPEPASFLASPCGGATIFLSGPSSKPNRVPYMGAKLGGWPVSQRTPTPPVASHVCVYRDLFVFRDIFSNAGPWPAKLEMPWRCGSRRRIQLST